MKMKNCQRDFCDDPERMFVGPGTPLYVPDDTAYIDGGATWKPNFSSDCKTTINPTTVWSKKILTNNFLVPLHDVPECPLSGGDSVSRYGMKPRDTPKYATPARVVKSSVVAGPAVYIDDHLVASKSLGVSERKFEQRKNMRSAIDERPEHEEYEFYDVPLVWNKNQIPTSAMSKGYYQKKSLISTGTRTWIPTFIL